MPLAGCFEAGDGDGKAILGLLGLPAGIWIGTQFLKNGYNLGRTQNTHAAVGWMLPLIMLGFFILILVFPQIQGQEQRLIHRDFARTTFSSMVSFKLICIAF